MKASSVDGDDLGSTGNVGELEFPGLWNHDAAAGLGAVEHGHLQAENFPVEGDHNELAGPVHGADGGLGINSACKKPNKHKKG